MRFCFGYFRWCSEEKGEREYMMEGKKIAGKMKSKDTLSDKDLIDIVFSWSLEDILNEELYKDQVEKIPRSFESLEHYFDSYIFPLLEETRSELSSSMEVISRAPFAEVVSFVECRSQRTQLYDVKVDSWKNRFSVSGKEPYRTLPGDIFVFADVRPETISDLCRAGRTWAFALVTKITEDEDEDDENFSTSTNFRVRASKATEVGDLIQKSLFVIFLINITTYKRIWNALHMFGNLKIIKEVLCTKSVVSIEAGFGISLFERLSSLGHTKHLLNMQYRMHPSISSFPNSKFYLSQIMDAANVKSRSYEKQYLPGLMFGPYSFINIFGGKEELDIGHSLKNMVEVAVVAKIVRNLHRAWSGLKQKLSIGVVSPYAAQVVAIQEKFGRKYEKLDNFAVKVKSIDGFQGGEEDIIIISTVRSNSNGSIGFLSDVRRTNVALTRARYCLWVLGNERTLVPNESIWQELVLDAKSRQCYFNADEDKDMAKAILEVKKEFDQLGDLLNGESVLFKKVRWKVLFSDDFKKSFGKLQSVRTKTSVINLLLKLSNGWRPKKRNVDTVCECSSYILKQFKVEGLYVVCSNDIAKELKYIQVLKVWDILPLDDIPKLIKRLDCIFIKYTDDFINRCKAKYLEGDLEVPKMWPISFDIVRFKDLSKIESEANLGDDDFDGRTYVENSKVNESLLLMKFYSLSPPVVSHLLSDRDVRELELPFEVTDQEMKIILFHNSTFILGRSGTGKTTVLTMKLFQNEQRHHIAMEGVSEDESSSPLDAGQNKIEGVGENKGSVLRQLFVTVSPKLCYAVKQHVSDLKRFAQGRKFAAESSSSNVEYIDDTAQFNDIADYFIDIPSHSFPLVITFHKFLMMLDGTLGSSYFERFFDARELSFGKINSRSVALETFIKTKEVSYDRFCSSYWPHFNTQLTKKFDPSRVFTEIISHIKGGLQAGVACDGKLSREDYLQLSESRNSTLTKMKRDQIYNIFQHYEKMKLENGDFDLADLVIDLHRRLVAEKYKGDEMDFVYVDEVQDLTMRQIALFKFICRNVDDGFVFSGDTAQTIARGIDFRFEDIRTLFYNEFLLESRSNESDCKKKKGLLAPIFHLNQNFRTHDGVLKLSQSVINLLYRFFPSFVDILDPEGSLIYGEPPILLESGNDEDAIMTIFRNSGNAVGSMVGFGAEQVILVRDDSSRNDISVYVGKQALILTIVECKGLEFQDVLLYNFFGSSPLKNHWRVIYEYMKEQELLDSTSPKSFPSFNEAKHNVLCSELKQLYVAITRTRQRLWICENKEEFSRPMFDYWKKLCLVQVRQLDYSLAQAMQATSTKEEWKSRGIKLLEEHNYVMAILCFERAGDHYWERLAKAGGLKADADRMHSSRPEMARNFCKEAAEIFEEIGEAKSAAKCYYQLNEFERAGKIYLEKCAESELEKAGECFFRAGCYELAADVYARGNFFTECLSVCTKGKFFDMGLQYIQYWKQHATTNNAMTRKSKDIEKLEQKFLESCALHHHELKDNKAMMKFVRAFHSLNLKRTFLKTLGCFEELLLLEEESGNLLEAANIARLRGDCLLEADLLGKACHFKEASMLVLWHVLANSLWSPGSKGWPLKHFTQKEELLTKAKTFAKRESDVHYELVLAEAKVLSKECSSLFEMGQFLSPSQGNRSLSSDILSARKVLDFHLHSNCSKYDWEDEMVTDLSKYSEYKLSLNRISVGTMVYSWNFWKERIVNIIKYLGCLETQDISEYVEYEEFCLNYLGVQKRHNNVNTVYLILYPGADWVKKIDERFLRRSENFVTIDARHFVLAAQNYWCSEISSVGVKVLDNLEALHKFSMNHFISLFAQSMLLIYIFHLVKFLMDSKFLDFKYQETRRLQSFLDLSTMQFFGYAFSIEWQKSLTENMISLRENKLSQDLLEEVVILNISSKNRLTCGQIGRVVMILLGSGKFNDGLYEMVAKRVNSPWRIFIEKLRGKDSALAQRSALCNSNEASREISLVCKFHESLEETFRANWRKEHDYISPYCFLYLIERLLILVSCTQGYLFASKSSFVDWIISLEQLTISNSLLVAKLPSSMGHILNFVANVLEQLLHNKKEMMEWIRRSNINVNYYPLLLLRLVIILCLLCLNSGRYYDFLFDLLGKSHVISQLPRNFLDVLRRGRKRNNVAIEVVAEAFKKIDNPLVIVSFGNTCSGYLCRDAIFVDMKANQSKKDILQVLFPKNNEAFKDEVVSVKFRTTDSCSGGSSLSSSNQKDKSENDISQVVVPNNIEASQVGFNFRATDSCSEGLSMSSNHQEGNSKLADLKDASGDHDLKTKHSMGEGNAQKICETLWGTFDVLNSDTGMVSNVNNFVSDAPRVKVEVEKVIKNITSALTKSLQSLPESEAGNLVQEANIMLNEFKQIFSALDVSEMELQKNIPTVLKLIGGLQSRRPRLESFFNQLNLGNDSNPMNQALNCSEADENSNSDDIKTNTSSAATTASGSQIKGDAQEQLESKSSKSKGKPKKGKKGKGGRKK
ncbi:uncharacterized protein LOC131145129 isoform X2 [Malania oleifera]|uniref:uncharacterized protein LOC131145129 isoform X2 n=1 Tax=Malania oleifera TaxID=397392 RepID=UPI0025AD9F10|nr:uncharacterized protein LOC131145129 isoform X2 [Malania oleifera]